MEALSAIKHACTGINTASKAKTSSPSDFFREMTYDPLARSTVPAVASAIFYEMSWYSAAWMSVGAALGVVTVRLAINVTKIYDVPLSKALFDLEEELRQVTDTHPYLKVACLVFSLFVAYFSISLGMTLGMICGGLAALTIDWERNEKEIVVSDAKEHGKGLGGIINQLV